jgi:hypothetical protein
MPSELLISSGLKAYDCQDSDNCVGVLTSGSGNCVCYSK